MGAPLGDGGSADVWKGQYNSKRVAAKALRIYSTSDREAIKKVGYPWCSVIHVNQLTTSYAVVLQGGHDLEDPLTPKRAMVGRCDDDGRTARDGLGVDGQWGHHLIS